MPTSATIVASDFIKTGGMDRANYALADYLARQGIRVDLVSHQVGGELAKRHGVTWRRVPRPLGLDAVGEILLDRAGRRSRQRSARSVFLVNGGNCVVPAVNWVHYLHAAYKPTASFGLRGAKQWVYARTSTLRERAALKKATLVIANSVATRNAIVERVGIDPERVRPVYYGIDAERFGFISEEACGAAKQRLGFTDRPLAAFVGGLGDRRKGFDTLFDAWEKLCRESAWDVDLIVIGRGAELRRWRERAELGGLSARVRFLGFRRDVPEVLAACDLLVAPTRYEAFGLGVLEAIARGVPAIVSSSAGVAELYPPDLAELLLRDPDSAGELAERLRRWRAASGAVRRGVQPFSERVRQRSWDHMAAEILELLVELR